MVQLTNPLVEVLGYGQSIWFDNIRRSLITSGELERMIREDGLRGVTSNPAIFEKAIAETDEYAAEIDELRGGSESDPKALYETIAIEDIKAAADILRSVYDETGGRDGYISLEVSPELAKDTEGTIAEAERLWATVARPNLMIKVPATPAGIPAIRTLISKGINVNVTLLFAKEAYEQVAEAYISGLEEHAAKGHDVSHVASVASFFISRIDTAVDKRLAAIGGPDAEALMGKAAIANAKLTYARYQEIYGGERWAALAAKGAHTQRLLWASTSTKNPDYRDVVYVEELIGPDTVDTVPPATFDAFRDHGKPRASLEEDVEGGAATMAALAKIGVDFDEVTDELLDQAVAAFSDAFVSLLASVGRTCSPATA